MKTELLYSELEELIKSVKITSSSSYEFSDQLYFERYNSQDRNSNNRRSKGVNLQLKDLLYRVYHCRKAFSSDTNIPHGDEYNEIQDFTGELSQNNSGKGTWEAGWEIMKLEKDGQLAVQKNGLTLWVFPKQFRPSNGSIGVGMKGYIAMVKEYRRLLPGFYMANGDAPNNEDEEQNITLVRLYWNIVRNSASLLMKTLTTQLNKRYVPFRFKILNNPYHYPRADGAVLYIHKQYYRESKDTLVKIYSEIKPFLNSATPLFAKQLAPGLSLAEDPKLNESYGQHRSRLLAEALYSASAKGIDSVNEIIVEIGTYFSNMGLRLDTPYLNPSARDDYEFLSP